MNAKKRTAPPDSRIDYRWPVDRDAGFEKSTLIYDAEGRLIAVDYKTTERVKPVTVN